MTHEQRQEAIARFSGKRYELAQKARDVAALVTKNGPPSDYEQARKRCQMYAEGRTQCLCEADFIANLAYVLL
jgi:hypothetical protein